MKINAIRGKNLASLEGEFDIDFTVEPLKSSGIFAITGATGAGKSTILDAMCLALFDAAPRLNNAEGVNISDVEDKTIGFRDSRNILRKGSIDGYAEVDFIALNGNTYRTRWTVRRARGKADGALQPAAIQLTNRTHNTEEQGTKTELLKKITELIGLTYDQFTRAVLLAQGEFSTFLKAKQNEKAELLEKLTGTEIYSKISALIFQKTNETKNDLSLLKQRIEDTKLLTDEEFENLETEKKQLDAEIVPKKKQLTTIERQLEWLKTKESLKESMTKAEKELLEIQTNITNAAPRYKYINQIDAAQEIRDSYLELQNKQELQKKQTESLEKSKFQLNNVAKTITESENKFNAAKANLDDLEQKYIALKPEIDKAREFDISIRREKEILTGQTKELQELEQLKSNAEKTVTTLTEQQSATDKTQKELSIWFTENERYKSIVPDAKWIVMQLDSAKKAKQQEQSVTKSVETSSQLLKKQQDSLKTLEQETERLNKLLPAEILTLRNQLVENEPCPVCGSIHHPFGGNSIQQTSANEKELEQLKKQNSDAVATAKSAIELSQKDIYEFETLRKTLIEQYQSVVNELNETLLPFADWKTGMQNGTFQKEISAIAEKWNVNKEHFDRNERQKELDKTKLDAERKALETIAENWKKKQKTVEEQKEKCKTLDEERAKILFNKSPEEAEKRYETKKAEYTKLLDTARAAKEKLEKEKSQYEGVISQLESDLKTTLTQLNTLQKNVDYWLKQNSYNITSVLLIDLMSKSRDWNAREKEFLEQLTKSQTIAQTTLSERKNQLKRHNEAEERPEKDTNKELLLQQQKELNEKTETLNNRITEISVALLTHTQGKERIKAFEKELITKNELYENWAKLNDLLGSATGSKFKTIAQGYTLDILLGYANRHLTDLTNRYKLEKISDTLALQVIDNDMLGNVRPVHSLSGGESFLISLSLALGLSTLSSNRMKIETLFIDEGFGSLDIDTLSIAMDALENLQTQGRRIGVISHVEEMKERIATQIRVEKLSNGRSTISIVG